jgi:hypothetical protein
MWLSRPRMMDVQDSRLIEDGIFSQNGDLARRLSVRPILPPGAEAMPALSTIGILVQLAGLTDLGKGQKVSLEIFNNQGKPAAKHSRALGNPSDDKWISAGVTQNGRYEMSPKNAELLENRPSCPSIDPASI